MATCLQTEAVGAVGAVGAFDIVDDPWSEQQQRDSAWLLGFRHAEPLVPE